DRLELEALRGAVEAHAPEIREAPLDILAGDSGLDALDPQEVLLVERTQALEAGLELRHFHVDVFLLHVPLCDLWRLGQAALDAALAVHRSSWGGTCSLEPPGFRAGR